MTLYRTGSYGDWTQTYFLDEEVLYNKNAKYNNYTGTVLTELNDKIDDNLNKYK